MTNEELVQEFQARREKRLSRAWSKYQPRNPIASDLGDCDRYQIMRIIAWQLKEDPDPQGKAVIEQGALMERPMISQLQDEGWEIVEQQAPIEIRQPLEPGAPKTTILTGKMDGKIRVNGSWMPFEIKDTSEWTVEQIDRQEDLVTQSQWTRRWWRQLQSYMLGGNYERALLILGFRGQRKVVPVALNYEEGERILQLCSGTVAFVRDLQNSGITHENIDDVLSGSEAWDYHGDFSVCRSCPFKDKACFPAEPSPEKVQSRPDLAPLVAKYLEAKPHASSYEKLKKALKEATEGSPTTIAGDYIIDGEVKTRRMKAKPAIGEHTQEYWSFEVRKAGER